MKKRIDVIVCLLTILIGFVFMETLAITYAEMLTESPFNSGWTESGYFPQPG